ncbi:hypothetical protein AB0M46_06395 [Dactylosporangium sp. NPDC051485]|uniref:hypothetical protein n=1 Tax=Dactylosporangium sp. NPDC051485 TaxID=3154846 RepID=UPI003418B595
MRDWIAAIVAALGVLLVLAGGALIFWQALGEARPFKPAAPLPESEYTPGYASDAPAPQPAAVPVSSRLFGAVKSPTSADRLIFWGIILLVLSAIAAGAISFDLGAKGGS